MNEPLLKSTSPKLAELVGLLAPDDQRLALKNKRETPRSQGGIKCQRAPTERDKYISFFFNHAYLNSRNGCWEWFGRTTNDGYGRLALFEGEELSHRIVAKLLGFSIDGLCVCHECDNPPCINPTHLFIGTHFVNMRDAFNKGRAPYWSVSKFTDAEALEILRNPTPNRQLAIQLKVSRSCIYDIRHGRRHKRVYRQWKESQLL